MPYQIFLVEDHPVVREAYVTVLGGYDDFALCGQAETAETALDEINGATCDLVITDVRLPGMSGIDLVGRLQETCPGLRTLVITGHEDEAFERQAYEAGASGFLPKRRAAVDLIPTVRSVLASPPSP